jgi:hypothetical protein
MTFGEVEDIFDGTALLEKDGKLYIYCSTAAEIIRRIHNRVFADLITGEEMSLSYDTLRTDKSLHAVYRR